MTMTYHLTPTRMVELKKQVITSIKEDVEELETSYTAGGNAKWRSTLKRQSVSF